MSCECSPNCTCDCIACSAHQQHLAPQEPHWETPCPKRDDRTHCNCWYDGEACCACGDPAEVRPVKGET